MPLPQTDGGVAFDPLALDCTERRFWRDVWASVPTAVAAEHGIESHRFGPVQVTLVGDLPQMGMVNLVLGATEPDAVPGGHLARALECARGRGITPHIPVTPGLPDTAAAEAFLTANGCSPTRSWMKFVRDAHPPRFRVAADLEVVELSAEDSEPFGMVAATGFGMPAWAATFFATLPGREGWRCYGVRLDGELQACGAMLLDGAVAELGVGATLQAARRRGCQLALLHRRILDAAEAGCNTLFVETGQRVKEGPAGSYRNILRAGFEEAYLCPNWTPRG